MSGKQSGPWGNQKFWETTKNLKSTQYQRKEIAKKQNETTLPRLNAWEDCHGDMTITGQSKLKNNEHSSRPSTLEQWPW